MLPFAVLQSCVFLNVVLAVFNLLPIPPLDGSRIVDGLMPPRLERLWRRFGGSAPVLLAALLLIPVLFGVNVLGWPIEKASNLINQAVVMLGA